MRSLPVRLEQDRLRIGDRLTVSFQRTLRVPDGPGEYPLPPGFGPFSLRRARDFAERLPSRWVKEEAFFFPMYRREATWIGFDGAPWKPNAVKVGVGGVNAISGEPWDDRLRADPQDYVVCPDQPWLDGINAGDGRVRQFVAAVLGEGLTVEAQLTGSEEVGGVQLLVFEPKPGRFPDVPPPRAEGAIFADIVGAPVEEAGMGIGAGGWVRQLIYPDPYGIDTWDAGVFGAATVYIVDAARYEQITGSQPPPTPIDARTYTEHGLPWFDLYDEGAGDVAAGERLRGVRSVGALESERSQGAAEPPLDVPEDLVYRLRHGGSHRPPDER